MLVGVLAVLLLGIVVGVVLVARGSSPATAPRPRTIPPEYDEPGLCSVVLGDAGPRQAETLTAIRGTTGVDLRQAREWAARTPCAIAGGLSPASAERVRARLEAAGASAWVERP